MFDAMLVCVCAAVRHAGHKLLGILQGFVGLLQDHGSRSVGCRLHDAGARLVN